MNKKEYIKAIEKISVSEEKMLEISEKIQVNKTRKSIVLNKYKLIVAVVSIIIILYVSNIHFNRNISNTTKYISLQNGKFFFNKVKSFDLQEAKIKLPEDAIEVTWSFEKVKDYFKKDFSLIYIPPTIKDNNLEESVSVYVDKSGDVIFDNITYYYGDFNTHGFILTISKEMPLNDEVFLTNKTRMSQINNTNILILEINSEHYYASFLYDGIGYTITSNGISQPQFIKVLQSIIE